jgi:hypothetical protein
MNEFSDAFKAGINAAREVEFKRREIHSVLREFSASLEVATDGALAVEVKTLSTATSAFMALLETTPKKQWLSVVTKATPVKSTPVAEWRQSSEGYPCTVVTEGKESVCFDRISLQQELARLAASPQMGEVIVQLMRPQEEP